MKKGKISNKFDSISLHLASPEDILSWSYGEVKEKETVNYRKQKSERGGLFCEKIFGPDQDYQCSCGKFKGPQYTGIICDECGVEIARSMVRRERMGHIELASPVAHIWFFGKTPSRIAQILGIKADSVKKVIYHSAYYITDVNEDGVKDYAKKLKKELEANLKNVTNENTRKILEEKHKNFINNLNLLKKDFIVDEAVYYGLSKHFSGLFKADKGAEVIYNILRNINLKKLEKKILKELETSSQTQNEKLYKQLTIVRWFLKSGNRPEWMFFTKLPVIPAGIRPLVSIEGGKWVSSSLNDLYRLIIIRNNRLKNFMESKAPKIFIDTQKRLVQESVDALLDGTVFQNKSQSTDNSKSRKLKSISEFITGKQGLFRKNLLGKRVDFTARSVIIVGPELKLDECGVPKEIALEIFKPFIIGEILKRELAYNIRAATRLIEDRDNVIWEILEKVIQNKYVLLNRQPTLHKQGILAFKPILIEGKAIELHPLVCVAFNADFDGDNMNIHLPLSAEAQLEAKEIMAASKNIIDPSTGDINVSPSSQDIVLGCYWATVLEKTEERKRKYFSTVSEAITAYDYGVIGFREEVFVLPPDKPKYKEFNGKPFTTSVGRILFNNLLPKEKEFVNKTLNQKNLKLIIKEVVDEFGVNSSIKYFDKIKDYGFENASRSGITFNWFDLKTPEKREEIIEEANKKIVQVVEQYKNGYISELERKNQSVSIWQEARIKMETEVAKQLEIETPITDVISSGARGNVGSLTSMIGMIGVVSSSQGDAIEHAITSSVKSGLTPFEIFNSSFGGRKGLADTALNTSSSGYQSRKLFVVAQDVNTTEKDCKTTKGFRIYKETSSGIGIPISKRIKGRFTASEVVDSKGKVIVEKNQRITSEAAIQIQDDDSVKYVKVRSPITCSLVKGICTKCYGNDVTKDEIVDLGESVGTIASQSIGSPATQLTLNTFHSGGVATRGGDIVSGLPRVIELFDRKKPKALAVISHIDGEVESIEDKEKIGLMVHIKTDKKVSIKDKQYFVPKNRFLNVKVGDKIKKGEFITDGSADISEYLKYNGREKTYEYIFMEISKVYELQGIHILPVHFEIIIRQMFSRYNVEDEGDSVYTKGETIEFSELIKENEKLEAEGKKIIIAEPTVTGIINVSTSRSNFLASSSFQSTTSVLIKYALQGAEDTLDGSSENVIIGRLVPVGTNFKGSKKYEMMEKLRNKIKEELRMKESENNSKI